MLELFLNSWLLILLLLYTAGLMFLLMFLSLSKGLSQITELDSTLSLGWPFFFLVYIACCFHQLLLGRKMEDYFD